MKQILFLVIGVVGISTLLLTGFLFLQDNKNGGGPASLIDDGQFRFKTAIGKKAPDFTVSDIDGKQITLSSFLGKNVILFFNEGLMCYPACLDQVVELSKDEKLNTEDTLVFSVVVDSPKKWQDAQKDLPYLKEASVLFDAGAKVSREYDTLALPSSMHKGVYPGHTYYLIDKEGIVRFTLDDPYMAIRNEELAKELSKL